MTFPRLSTAYKSPVPLLGLIKLNFIFFVAVSLEIGAEEGLHCYRNLANTQRGGQLLCTSQPFR